MRIIHDIETPTQVAGGADPYLNVRGWQGYNGARCEILITEDCAENNPKLPAAMFDGEEPIFIEGNSRYVIEALEKALSLLKSTVKLHQADLGPKRRTNCPNCKLDAPYTNATHKEDCPVSIKWHKETKKHFDKIRRKTRRAKEE